MARSASASRAVTKSALESGYYPCRPCHPAKRPPCRPPQRFLHMAKFRWIDPLSLGAMATSARTLDTLRSLHDRIDDLTISPSQRLVKTGGPWSGFSGSHLAHRLVEH